MAGNWCLYGHNEIPVYDVHGVPCVPIQDVADALTLELHRHKLGWRLHDKPAIIQSGRGKFLGYYRGPSVYVPLPGIFETHGFRVERRTKDGLEFYWIGPGPGQ